MKGRVTYFDLSPSLQPSLDFDALSRASGRMHSHQLPNSALLDQGGGQARRAAPLTGPAARPSLGAGRPGNQSLGSAKKIPWPGFRRLSAATENCPVTAM